MVGIGGGKQVRIERWMSVGVGVFVVLVCVGGGGREGKGRVHQSIYRSL